MNWKNRLTNYNFWVSIVSAVLLILQALKIKVDFIYVNEVSTAILGLLVVIGIINDPTKSNKTSAKKSNESTDTNISLSANQDAEDSSKNDKNFLENENFASKNEENLQNSAENLKNLENLQEKQDLEVETENKNVNDSKTTNEIPTDNEDEVSNIDIQADLSHDEVKSETNVFKIVN